MASDLSQKKKPVLKTDSQNRTGGQILELEQKAGQKVQWDIYKEPAEEQRGKNLNYLRKQVIEVANQS